MGIDFFLAEVPDLTHAPTVAAMYHWQVKDTRITHSHVDMLR